MKSIIITIGDELLIGQVVNTNAAFIAQQLNACGVEVVRTVTVPDSADAIVRCIGESLEACDALLLTGGLGPTHDDVTRSAICTFYNTDLVADGEARKNVERIFSRRAQAWSTAAENQTLIPRVAKVIPNARGTAPGELIEEKGKTVIVMPGVPAEMEGMMVNFVVPYFSGKSTGKSILHRTLRTTGVAESVLASRLGEYEEMLGNDSLAFLPSLTGVRLRITVVRAEPGAAQERAREIEAYIRARVENSIYGTGDEELEEVVGRLLTERSLTIAVAESCTGGLIAHRLTNVSGSSLYFERGVVAYSNASKISLLGVPAEAIAEHGAVSEEVAAAMAAGIRERAQTDIGLSVTGVAGPTGGTAQKPVGLVWIGYADTVSASAAKYHLGEERIRVKERASQVALETVRRRVLRLD